MNAISRIGQSFFRLFVFLIFIGNVDAQTDCNCHPDFKVVFDQCVQTGVSTQIALFVHDAQRPGAQGWAKLYANNNLVFDSEITLSSKGVFQKLLEYIPDADTKFFLEYHCKKDECYTSWTGNMQTLPQYTLLKQDVSCNGMSDGSVILSSGAAASMGVSWETGEVKNHASGLKPGDYQVTVQYSNGCSTKEKIHILNPEKIKT